MAQRKCIGIRDHLNSIISPQRLGILAKKAKFIVRNRKILPVQFFWTVILGFGEGKEKTVASLRRKYEELTGQSIAASSFSDRFSLSFLKLLKFVLTYLFAFVAESNPKYAGILKQFDDVLIADATVVRLHRLLENSYPSSRTNHTKASAKINMVICAQSGSPTRIQVSEGRRHEAKNYTVGKWIKDRLILFDQGYFKYQLFNCITRNRGFFISRLKKNVDPLIIKVHQTWRGNSISLEGKRLSEVKNLMKRKVLDVEVEVAFKTRKYNGKCSGKRQKLRLVGLLNEDTKCYHFYVTNIPVDKLIPQDIGKIYELRWQIELVFKELKSHYRLDHIKSRKSELVESAIYASIITLIVSKELLAAVRRKLKLLSEIPEMRWAILFSGFAGKILTIVAGFKEIARHVAKRLEPMLLNESVDPNKNRLLLLPQVERGVFR